MDTRRFDSFTRSLAFSINRRRFLALASGAGFAFTLGGAQRFAITAQEATPSPAPVPVSKRTPEGSCVMPFEVTVRQGPSAGANLRGLFSLTVDDDGTASGNLSTIPYPAIPVVGQVTGAALSLRFELGDDQVLYGTGVMNGDLETCTIYDMGGPAVGPVDGDTGDWRTIGLPIDLDLPTACLLGDPACIEPTERPEPPEETPVHTPNTNTCALSDAFVNCVYVCASSRLVPFESCGDYCADVFGCYG